MSERTIKLPAKAVGRLQRIADNAQGILDEGMTDKFILTMIGAEQADFDRGRVLGRFMTERGAPLRLPGLTLKESDFVCSMFAIGLGACADAALKRLAVKHGPLDDYRHLLDGDGAPGVTS